MAGTVQNTLLGQLAVKARFVSESELDECLRVQEKMRRKSAGQASGKEVPKIGTILAHRGYLSKEQVKALLSGRFNEQQGTFGEIAIRLGFVAQKHVDYALEKQSRAADRGGRAPLLGKILVRKGYLKKHQVAAILAAQGKTLAECPDCGKSYTKDKFREGRSKCRGCGSKLVAAPTTEVGLDSEVVAADPDEGAGDASRVEIDLSEGDRISRYQILGRLGQDASGVLYKASERGRQEPVTLKILDPSRFKNRSFKKRFLENADRSSQLSHKSIKRLLMVGRSKGRHYVAMEYVEGRSLREVLAKKGKLGVYNALKIAGRIADALRYAKDNGLDHPDLRPANVLIDDKGKVKVANVGLPVNVSEDFKFFATEKGEGRRGKMAFYMAPEEVTGKAAGSDRGEVFTLGCLLYEMLSGRPVLRARTPAEGLTRLTERGVRPLQKVEPGLPKPVYRVVAKMLEIEPEDRFDGLANLRVEFKTLAQEYGKPEVEGGKLDLDTISLDDDEDHARVQVSQKFKRAMAEAHERAAQEEKEEEERRSQRRPRTEKTRILRRDDLSERLQRAAGADALQGEKRSGLRTAMYVAAGLVALVAGVVGTLFVLSSKERHEAKAAAIASSQGPARWVDCAACNGTGQLELDCPVCEGDGVLECYAQDPLTQCVAGQVETRPTEDAPWTQTGEECFFCADSPEKGQHVCSECKGAGAATQQCLRCQGRKQVQE